LEFELDSLRSELLAQQNIVNDSEMAVKEVRDVIFLTLLVNFQNWFVARRALKNTQRLHASIEHSLFYYRVRRLVQMKRDVDATLVSEINIHSLGYSYSELTRELEEYVAYKMQYTDGVVSKIARSLISKLRTRVLITRRRRLKREELLATLQRTNHDNIEKRTRQKQLRAIRKKLEHMSVRKWMCVRPECGNRKFLTEDRYATHMNIHYTEDAEKERNRLLETDAQKRLQDEQFEKIQRKSVNVDSAMGRIAETHTHLCLPVIVQAKSLPYLRTHMETVYALAHKPQPSAVDCCVKPGTSAPVIGKQTLKEYSDISFAVPLESSALPHLQSCASIAAPLHHVELLSRSEHVYLIGGSKYVLNQPVIRVGTQSSCEINVSTSGNGYQPDTLENSDAHIRRQPPAGYLHELPRNTVSRVHCMLFTAMTDASTGVQTVTVVDNNSATGTYVISAKAAGMAILVPSKASAGMVLCPGDLLCIGVSLDSVHQGEHNVSKRRFPPPILNALEASTAAIVFRLRCIELER
jgi:hypothetical protein